MAEGQDDGTVGAGIHAVRTAGDRGNRFECVTWCPAAPKHINEYRANRVRPTPTQTAAYRALEQEAPE